MTSVSCMNLRYATFHSGTLLSLIKAFIATNDIQLGLALKAQHKKL